jgi:hypothetical protein
MPARSADQQLHAQAKGRIHATEGLDHAPPEMAALPTPNMTGFREFRRCRLFLARSRFLRKDGAAIHAMLRLQVTGDSAYCPSTAYNVRPAVFSARCPGLGKGISPRFQLRRSCCFVWLGSIWSFICDGSLRVRTRRISIETNPRSRWRCRSLEIPVELEFRR